jgi:hypothetical protein
MADVTRLIVEPDLDGYASALALIAVVPDLVIWTHRENETYRDLARILDGAPGRTLIAAPISRYEGGDVVKASRKGPAFGILGECLDLGLASDCLRLQAETPLKTEAVLAAAECGELARFLGRTATALPSQVRNSLTRWIARLQGFAQGQNPDLLCLLNEVLNDHRERYLPSGHSRHHQFVGEMLDRVADLAHSERPLAEIEAAVPRIRHGLIDDLLTGTPSEQGRPSSKRLIRFIADDRAMMHGIHTEFGLVKITDSLGHPEFSAIAKEALRKGDTALVIGFDERSNLTLVSRNGIAGQVSPRFKAVGEPDRAVGRVPPTQRRDRADALQAICALLGVDVGSRAQIALTLNDDAMTYDFLQEGLPLRLKGRDVAGRRRVNAILILPGASREDSYDLLAKLTAGTVVHLAGRWATMSPRTGFHAIAEFQADEVRLPTPSADLTPA